MDLQENSFRSALKALIAQDARRYSTELRALDLVGAPRRKVARLLSDATGERVTLTQLQDWARGESIPDRFAAPLRQLAEWGVVQAMEVLVESTHDQPHIVLTIGWRRSSQRIREAGELLRLRSEDASTN